MCSTYARWRGTWARAGDFHLETGDDHAVLPRISIRRPYINEFHIETFISGGAHSQRKKNLTMNIINVSLRLLSTLPCEHLHHFQIQWWLYIYIMPQPGFSLVGSGLHNPRIHLGKRMQALPFCSNWDGILDHPSSCSLRQGSRSRACAIDENPALVKARVLHQLPLCCRYLALLQMYIQTPSRVNTYDFNRIRWDLRKSSFTRMLDRSSLQSFHCHWLFSCSSTQSYSKYSLKLVTMGSIQATYEGYWIYIHNLMECVEKALIVMEKAPTNET